MAVGLTRWWSADLRRTLMVLWSVELRRWQQVRTSGVKPDLSSLMYRVHLVLLAMMDWMESLVCPAHLVLLVPLALAE